MNAQREVVAAAVPQRRQNQTVLWVIAVLLAVIATAMVLRPEMPFRLPAAYGDSRMMGANGIFAFTGQIDRNSYGLFMMDVDNNTVWCYQYVPGIHSLKLVAARSFLYDKSLENYNCGDPTPDRVSELVETERKLQNRISGGGGLAPDKPLDPSDLSPESLGKEGSKESNE